MPKMNGSGKTNLQRGWPPLQESYASRELRAELSTEWINAEAVAAAQAAQLRKECELELFAALEAIDPELVKMDWSS